MLQKILERAKTQNLPILIYAHKNPDADAMASAKTLERFFKEHGISAQYILRSTPYTTYDSILGQVHPTNSNITENSISIILDTSTLEHVENDGFKASAPENTFIIDHHERKAASIEDSLGIPSENTLIDSTSSSTCEIIASKLHEMKLLNPDYSTMLLLGMCTDTGSFRYLKPDSLKNLLTLLQTGGNLSSVMQKSNEKQPLKAEVGLSKMLLNTKRVQVGSTYINILGLSYDQVDELSQKYGVLNPSQNIFRLYNIEDSSISIMLSEMTPGEYDCEFRSAMYNGNIDVATPAITLGGGGHHNASGCTLRTNDGLEKASKQLYSTVLSSPGVLETLTNFLPALNTPEDMRIMQILNDIDRFNKTASIQTVSELQTLFSSPAHYTRCYDSAKLVSFKDFLLRAEILAQIPDEDLDKKVVAVNLGQDFLEKVSSTHHASEEDLEKVLNTFEDIDVDEFSISLPSKNITIKPHDKDKEKEL